MNVNRVLLTAAIGCTFGLACCIQLSVNRMEGRLDRIESSLERIQKDSSRMSGMMDALIGKLYSSSTIMPHIFQRAGNDSAFVPLLASASKICWH